MKSKVALSLIGLSILGILIRCFLIDDSKIINILNFSSTIAFLIGIIIIIPFELIPEVIFDTKEWRPNPEVKDIVKKMRMRAILFNNLSVSIFVITILIIITGFYLLVHPIGTPSKEDITISLTIRIAASVLLIFLVQILFRVFKYLLRVAAFYNGKADALEYSLIHPDQAIDKLIDLFTPEKYDISDIEQSTVAGSLVSLIKGKGA